MSDLKALIEQRDELSARIEQMQREQKSAVIKEIHEWMREYGVTLEELQTSQPKPAKEKRAPKYRHPQTGHTWSGRGKRPQWVHEVLAAGQSLAAFAIESA